MHHSNFIKTTKNVSKILDWFSVVLCKYTFTLKSHPPIFTAYILTSWGHMPHTSVDDESAHLSPIQAFFNFKTSGEDY